MSENLMSLGVSDPPRIDGGVSLVDSWAQVHASLSAIAVDLPVPVDIRDYLAIHPDLNGLTEKICRGVRKEFGADAFLQMNLYRDPEIEDRYLSLCVRLPEYGTRMTQRLRAIADAFDDELCQSSGSILITSDFLPIR